MPQINQLADVAFSQFFWLLLVLGVIYFGIGRGMLPRIQSTVDSRDSRIAEDLAAAQRAHDAAEASDARYRELMDANRAEAIKLTQAAKDKGASDAEKRLAAANADLAEKAAAAEAALQAATKAAVADIEKLAAEAAEEIVAKLTGLKVGKAQAAQAVKAAMADV